MWTKPVWSVTDPLAIKHSSTTMFVSVGVYVLPVMNSHSHEYHYDNDYIICEFLVTEAVHIFENNVFIFL